MRYLIAAFVFLLAVPASAAVPARLPVQGFLTDASSSPIDGTLQVQFQLYTAATGGTALYSEMQSVVVDKGDFTVQVGANVPLDMKLFRSGAAFVGVTIGTGPELTPRLELGTVPYAAFAQETAAVPPGAVMMFDLDTCPDGWAPLDAARGRALVGVPTGGTRGGTVGVALADMEDRQHAHTVDPGAVISGLGGAHTHTVDLGSVTTSTAGTHSHAWSAWNNTRKAWSSFNISGGVQTIIDWTTRGGDIGMDTVGGGNHPIAVDDTLPLGTQEFFTENAGSHTHTVNAPATTTSASSTHAHSVDLPATASSNSSAGMPYLQLLVCKKE